MNQYRKMTKLSRHAPRSPSLPERCSHPEDQRHILSTTSLRPRACSFRPSEQAVDASNVVKYESAPPFYFERIPMQAADDESADPLTLHARRACLPCADVGCVDVQDQKAGMVEAVSTSRIPPPDLLPKMAVKGEACERPSVEPISADLRTVIRLLARPTCLPSSLHMLYLLLEPSLSRQDASQPKGNSPRWRLFGSSPTADSGDEDRIWGVAAINIRADQPRAHVWISCEANQQRGGPVSQADSKGEALLRQMIDEFFLPALDASADGALRMMFASINQCWIPELRRRHQLYYEGPCTKAAKKIKVRQEVGCAALPHGFRIRNVQERDLQQVRAELKFCGP